MTKAADAPHQVEVGQRDFTVILRDDERFAGVGADDVSRQINTRFDRLMEQSGLEVAPSVLLLLCLLGAVGLGGAVFVVQENLLTAAVGAAIGFGIPPVAALVVRSRRQMQMLGQMPGMVEELARAARTGRSLEQCFQQVAEDTPSPLGGELQLCARKMQMGLGVAAALRDLPVRTGLVSMNVFVTALTVHHQTGGDLVRVLERLAHTVRERLTFLGRLRAATAASRATAVLMLALPPGILAFFMLRDPNYLTDLTASRWGRGTLIAALVLQVIGSIWILRILRKTRRT